MFDGLLIPLLRKAFWFELVGFSSSFILASIGIIYDIAIVLKAAFILGICSMLLLGVTTAYQRYIKCPSCHRSFFGPFKRVLPWRSRCAFCDRQL